VADPTAAQRRTLAQMHIAMPDGTYYVRNADDLNSAIILAGKAGDNAPAVRKHIMTRAAALKLSSKIPDTWNPDGTLKVAHELADEIDEFFAHFGVKGMKWGVRRGKPSSSGPVSPDAARARALKTQVKTSGTKSLNNDELQHLVTRLNLEQQYGRLSSGSSPNGVSRGQKFVKGAISTGKLGLDAYKTGSEIKKLIDSAKK
jgi:hypothetical protein